MTTSVFAWLLAALWTVVGVGAETPARGADRDASGAAYKYVILIDAGSSGSRIHVHRYVPGAGRDDMPRIEPSETLKVKPGLSSFAPFPQEAGKSLKGLLDFARDVIPDELEAETALHLQATAGLRVLSRPQRNRILESCRRFIRDYGRFLSKPSWVKVISGRREGLNGWLATNYLMGHFGGMPRAKPLAGADTDQAGAAAAAAGAAGELGETTGVIELGGASMQITYVPRAASLGGGGGRAVVGSAAKAMSTLRLGGRTYQVYTHSYLNYGLEKAQDMYHARRRRVLEQEGNPCYPPEMPVEAAKRSRVVGRPTGRLDQCRRAIEDSLFGAGGAQGAGDGSQGAGQGQQCPHASCSFDGVFQPPITDERFVCIENFRYTTQFFGIPRSESDFVKALETKGRAFCATAFRDLQLAYPRTTPDDLAKYCFSSAYVTSVLSRALRVPRPDRNLRIEHAVNGVDIDWALGAVVHEVLEHEAHGDDENDQNDGGAGAGEDADDDAAEAKQRDGRTVYFVRDGGDAQAGLPVVPVASMAALLVVAWRLGLCRSLLCAGSNSAGGGGGGSGHYGGGRGGGIGISSSHHDDYPYHGGQLRSKWAR